MSVSLKNIIVPTWFVGIESYYQFVQQYSAGNKRIQWKKKSLHMRTEDPDWIRKTCEIIAKLDRYDLCTLYTYTTPVYSVITGLLRHAGSKYDTGLVHDPETEWLFGSDTLFESIDKDGNSLYLNTKNDKKLVLAYKKARQMPSGNTEEEANNKWNRVDRLYAKCKPFFTKAYLDICHTKSVESNSGILFFPQAVRLFKDTPSAFPTIKRLKTLRDFKQIIPLLTNDIWIKIIERFVNDIDEIIVKMPVTECIMSVFRGVTHDIKKKTMIADPSFLSTTLSKEIARSFVENNSRKCCMYRWKIPVGSRVLPMIPITRYFAEQEILLPRGSNRETYTVSLVT